MNAPAPDRELPEWLQRMQEDDAAEVPLSFRRKLALVLTFAALSWLTVVGAVEVAGWLL